MSKIKTSHSDNNSTTAILNLFKAVWIKDTALLTEQVSGQTSEPTTQHKEQYQQLLAQTIPFGYVLDPRIDSRHIHQELLTDINTSIGLSAQQANQAFHKSWQTIADSTDEQLRIQQITHYMTTYGFEALGIYDKNSVYIPNEVLEAPEITNESISLQVIKALSTEELVEKVLILSAGIALAKETLADLLTIIRVLFNADTSLDKHDFVQKIANRELNTLLADEFNIVPNEPVAFLRHMIYQLTGDSLLIKNKRLIDSIKEYQKDTQAIRKMDETLEQAPENLASIFLRYKPLFLALRSISYNKKVFNRLRKDAKKQHQPLPTDYLNNVTNAIKTNSLDMATFTEEVTQATIYRKIRLANALRYRLNVASSNNNDTDSHSIVYRVRNGRGFATDFAWLSKHTQQTEQAYNTVVSAIADDIRPNVADRIFYIPENVNYTLPATEKQFTGNFPTGSWVSVSDNLIVGIHWENVEANNQQQRIDLDLSLMDLDGTKIGWNASHKSRGNQMIFSGDMTDAPKPIGATELFYIKQDVTKSQVLMVNYFNHCKDYPVPGKLIVANETMKNFGKNYMVDPNNILMQTQFHLTEKQNMLGLINNVNGENRIYFANINLGTSISSHGDEYTKHAQQYLLNISENVLMLREVLEMAGATVIDTMPIDLDLDLDSDTDHKTADAKPKGFLNNLIDSIVDRVGKSDTLDTSEVKDMTDKVANIVTDTAVVEEVSAPPIIDLSPAMVDTSTFIKLMHVGS